MDSPTNHAEDYLTFHQPGAFPLVRVGGSHFEIGLQLGRACSEGVRRFLRVVVAGAAQARGWDRCRTLAETRRFLPLFERHCPHLLEEVRGLAEGAEVSFDEALLLQLRGEVARLEEGCSAYVLSRDATTTGQVIIGQNSDMTPVMQELGLVLHVTPAVGPRAIMFTFPGLLGYHGMNSVGVAHFANALPDTPWRFALSHYPLKRMFLEQESVQGCLDLLDRVPVCSPGNYVLGDGEGRIIDVELTPTGYATWLGDGVYIAHTNHYLCPEFAQRPELQPIYADSKPRLERLRALLAERAGRLDVEALKVILSDHSGYPHGLCRHVAVGTDREIKTVASIIAEPERGLFHIAAGNPCQAPYATYEV